MLVTSKYLRITDINLKPMVTPIQAQIKRVYKVESTGVHRLDFEVTFITTRKYYGDPIGSITGQAGAVISGVDRDSQELMVKCLEVASALDTAIVASLNKHGAKIGYEPLDYDIYLPSIRLYLQMQNPGLGNVKFDVWGRLV